MKNKLIINFNYTFYFIFCSFFFFFLTYSKEEFFNEDLIIIVCFFYILSVLHKKLENIIVTELDNRINNIKEQFLEILNIKHILLSKNLKNIYLNINIFFYNIIEYIFYLNNIFLIISLKKLNEVSLFLKLNFLEIVKNNNILEINFLKNNLLFFLDEEFFFKKIEIIEKNEVSKVILDKFINSFIKNTEDLFVFFNNLEKNKNFYFYFFSLSLNQAINVLNNFYFFFEEIIDLLDFNIDNFNNNINLTLNNIIKSCILFIYIYLNNVFFYQEIKNNNFLFFNIVTSLIKDFYFYFFNNINLDEYFEFATVNYFVLNLDNFYLENPISLLFNENLEILEEKEIIENSIIDYSELDLFDSNIYNLDLILQDNIEDNLEDEFFLDNLEIKAINECLVGDDSLAFEEYANYAYSNDTNDDAKEEEEEEGDFLELKLENLIDSGYDSGYESDIEDNDELDIENNDELDIENNEDELDIEDNNELVDIDYNDELDIEDNNDELDIEDNNDASYFLSVLDEEFLYEEEDNEYEDLYEEEDNEYDNVYEDEYEDEDEDEIDLDISEVSFENFIYNLLVDSYYFEEELTSIEDLGDNKYENLVSEEPYIFNYVDLIYINRNNSVNEEVLELLDSVLYNNDLHLDNKLSIELELYEDYFDSIIYSKKE